MSIIHWQFPGLDPTTAQQAGTAADPKVATTGQLFAYYHATHGWWILRYVQLKDAVTYAAGQVLTLAATGRTAVTNDVAGGSSLGLIFGGIALMVYTQNYYGFVLVDGYYPTIKDNGDDDIAAGDGLIVANSDGVCDSGTSATTHFGNASAADVDADNTVAGIVYLRGM